MKYQTGADPCGAGGCSQTCEHRRRSNVLTRCFPAVPSSALCVFGVRRPCGAFEGRKRASWIFDGQGCGEALERSENGAGPPRSITHSDLGNQRGESFSMGCKISRSSCRGRQASRRKVQKSSIPFLQSPLRVL